MKIVQERSLLQAVERMDHLDEQKAHALMEEFTEKQPQVLGYVMALEEEFSDTGDFQALLHLVVTIWLSFQFEFGSMPRVQQDHIVAKEQTSVAEMMDMSGMNEDQLIQTAIDMFSNVVQPILIQFVSDELVILEEEGELSDGENAASQMFPILKLVVELFDDAINKPNLRIV